MRRKIPSFEALIAFEAAARHQSFTRAADELALTQSAVGRQVVLLEQYLGMRLFDRIKKRISLTEVGQIYAKEIREDLTRIETHTLAAIARRGTGGTLELAVIPTFGNRWLIPRLPQFYAKHRDITLNITTRPEPFLFTDTPYDAAIHFGNAVWPGAITEHLFGEEIIPVCNPDLLNGSSRLQPSDLQKFDLLHQSARPDAWRQWFAQAGIHDFNSMKGARFELFSMLIEAARAGLGMALVPRFLVLRELDEQALTVPCPLSLHSEKGYYLVYPERKQSSAALQTFRDWLLSAAGQYRDTGL